MGRFSQGEFFFFLKTQAGDKKTVRVWAQRLTMS